MEDASGPLLEGQDAKWGWSGVACSLLHSVADEGPEQRKTRYADPIVVAGLLQLRFKSNCAAEPTPPP